MQPPIFAPPPSGSKRLRAHCTVDFPEAPLSNSQRVAEFKTFDGFPRASLIKDLGVAKN
jgi:hypothetical protein